MLGEKDTEIWKLCHQYGFETKLVPCFIDDNPEVICYNAPFGQRHSVVTPQWNVLTGTHHLSMKIFDYFAAVKIKCPNRLWREDFVTRNLNGDMFGFLLSVHPLFAEYLKWNGSGNYLIGYCSPLDMYDSVGIPSRSFAELGRRGELRGIDMIIWRLCRHFGFEMTSFLMIDDGDDSYPNGYVMEWDKITNGQFDRAAIDWNAADWNEPSWSWNTVWDDRLPKLNGIEVWRRGEGTGIYTGRPVLQIRCHKHQSPSMEDSNQFRAKKH